MNGKAGKTKPKMADVTKPKKTTTDGGAQELVIQSRPIIGRVAPGASVVDPTEATGGPTTAPTLPTSTKRTVIVPIKDGEAKDVDADAPKADPSDANVPEVVEPKTDKPTTAPTVKQDAADTKVTPQAPAPTENDAKDQSDESEEGDEAEDKEAAPKDSKPNPETQKAIEEAAAAEKREHELEAYIDSHQFFVPINAVARKRSIKHSFLMTIVVFLLGVVLIDLMLDSGLILLAEKIPHTHFFTISTGS